MSDSATEEVKDIKSNEETFYPGDEGTQSEEKKGEASEQSEEQSTETVDEQNKESEETADKDGAKTSDLKLSKDSMLDDQDIAEVKEFAKTHGLSDEVAQAVLEFKEKTVSDEEDARQAEVDANAKVWLKQTEQDPEVGGEHLKESVSLAQRVIGRFGDEALRNALVDSGLGNHPAVVKIFSRIGKAMSEDTLIVPGTPGVRKAQKSIEETFYPTETSNKE